MASPAFQSAAEFPFPVARRVRFVMGLFLALLAMIPYARAQYGLPEPRFVYYPDQTAPGEVPAWLREIPAPSNEESARRDFQIIPPRGGLELAITISFDEPESAEQLLAYFRGARSGRTVNANLNEGTGLPNQRTILLRRRQLEAPGVLSLIASGPELLVWRMEFQWMKARSVLVPLGSVLESPAAVLGDGTILHYDEVASGATRPPREEWVDNVIRFPLVEQPERIEAGVEYVFTLETVPQAAVLQLDLAGLPPNAQTRLMLNGRVAGWVQTALPSLAHGGYRSSDALGEGDVELAGWRNARAWIPTTLLKTGENSFWLEFYEVATSPDSEADTTPGGGLQPALLFGVALRHMLLEMDFGIPAEPVLNAPAEHPSPEAALADTALAEDSTDTAAQERGDDSPANEQSDAQAVTIKGEVSYELFGDMAPALMLFMEEAPDAEVPAAAPAAAAPQP